MGACGGADSLSSVVNMRGMFATCVASLRRKRSARRAESRFAEKHSLRRSTRTKAKYEYCDHASDEYMDPTEYKISPYNSAYFGAELGICEEGRNGPSRHNADYVISNPRWKHPHAFCKEHLEKNATDEPALRFAWERTKS